MKIALLRNGFSKLGAMVIVAFVAVVIIMTSKSVTAADAKISRNPESAQAFKELQASVRAAAEPALREWIKTLDPASAPNFGFNSPRELERATALTPIPLFSPSRDLNAPLTEGDVEDLLDQLPATWVVPVAVDDRVASIIMVDTIAGYPPTPTEFGKMFMANRLNVGMKAVRRLSGDQWNDLRYLSFVSPVEDLLLFRQANHDWVWLDLTGTTDTNATVLGATEIAELLIRLADVPPGPVPPGVPQ